MGVGRGVAPVESWDFADRASPTDALAEVTINVLDPARAQAGAFRWDRLVELVGLYSGGAKGVSGGGRPGGVESCPGGEGFTRAESAFRATAQLMRAVRMTRQRSLREPVVRRCNSAWSPLR